MALGLSAGQHCVAIDLELRFGGSISGFTPRAAWAPLNTLGTILPVWPQSSQTGTPGGFAPGAVLPRDVIVHSTDTPNGSGSGIASVLWTSPCAGTIDISGDIWWVRPNLRRTNDFSIAVGGAVFATGSVINGGVNTRSNLLQFSSGLLAGQSFTGIPVSAGESVELAVTQDASSPFGEISGVNFQIAELTATATPEPRDLTLLIVGLGFMPALRSA